MRPSSIAKLSLIAGFAVAPAVAEEEASPWLQVDVPVELQFDAVVAPSVATLNDLYLSAYPSISLRAADWFSVEFGLAFEPVTDATEDRALESHGLYLSSAEAVASFGPVMLQAGKFSPNFSIGFAFTPGLNGDTFNADTEIAERVGLRGSYNLTGDGSAAGVIVSVAAFRRDTSVFSDSAFQHRGRLHVADGGPGNHSGLESFTAALDVIEPEWAPGLHAHLGYLQQHAGLGDAVDAKAWVAGVYWTFGGDEEGKYQLLAEWARSEDAIGFSDAVSVEGASQTLLTFAAAGGWADTWVASVAYGLRDTDDPLGGETEEWFTQLTLGYFVSDDLSVEVGWQRYEGDSEPIDTLSFRVASGFEYAVE